MRELRERAGQIVKIVCLLLAALVAYQVVGIGLRWNPFRGVTVPELPALATATNRPAGTVPATNATTSAAVKNTNSPPHLASTNSSPSLVAAGTNLIVPAAGGTNVAAHSGSGPMGTNRAIAAATNRTNNVVEPLEAKSAITNTPAALLSTNKGTNRLLLATATDTNVTAKPKRAGAAPTGPDMAGRGMNMGRPGGRAADLPPAVQARIARITDSEILAPVMRPLPMALLGIAGDFAFLRSANGQTGLVKEGDSLDDLKLIRIGVNRVLIEQDGLKKELMIFSGYGGETLLPKDSTNENIHP